MTASAPKLTPHQKVEVMVQSYIESYRRAGIQATPEQITQDVIGDLTFVDAAERNGLLRGGGSKDPGPAAPRSTTNEILDQAAASRGLRFLKPSDKPPDLWRPGFMFSNPQTVSERWGMAVARYGRILKEGTEEGSRLAELAREAKTVYALFLTRGIAPAARGFKRNEFDDLKDRDAARLYMRRVEDICDKSSGALGPWFVPK